MDEGYLTSQVLPPEVSDRDSDLQGVQVIGGHVCTR